MTWPHFYLLLIVIYRFWDNNRSQEASITGGFLMLLN